MNSKHGGHMGFSRLNKTIKSAGGGDLTALTNRIVNLEKFSIQRTLDVVVTDVFKKDIAIDLLTNESVQIDILLKFTGFNLVPLKINPVNVNVEGAWDEYNGTIIGGNTGALTTLNKTSHSGTVLHQIETQGMTASISCKIFKVYDQGVHSGRYSFTSTGVYCFAGVGHSKIEVTAMCHQFRPTAFRVFVPNIFTLMSFSYSIINDKLITS